MTQFYLVLLETSGNQGFIFATNRLRENIGASELTYQAGTFWIGDAVDKENQQEHFKNCCTPKEFRDALRSQDKIDSTDRKAEIMLAASGKALVLARDAKIARNIVAEVTGRALLEAPGLDLAGVYLPFTWSKSDSKSLADAVKAVHKEFEKARSRRPSPENRFLRLPIIASCAVSGLPASTIGKDPRGGDQRISLVSSVKRDTAQKGIKRLQKIAQPHSLASDINKLEKVFETEDMSWIAIVHADGNGLGQIFLDFHQYIGDQNNRNYIQKYREFSLALDECTEEAFRQALDEVLPKGKDFLPIVPLIIGGDDLTVVCHGKYALEFTRVFLHKFEEETQRKNAIAEIAQKAFGIGRLSACAGIAIVKRHFPFSVAYELAEDLIKSAKTVKRKVTKRGEKNTPFPCSAIDFHILYDTSGVDLDDIRTQLRPEPNTELYNRPYVVSKVDALNAAEGHEWAKLHQWQRLGDRVQALKAGELPSSQSHAIRTALFISKQATDAQCDLIRQRYCLSSFTETKESLFHESEGTYRTSFLDALDAMKFLENNQTEQPRNGNEEEVA